MTQETYHKLPSLERLNVLVGEWNVDIIFPNNHHLHGREDFEWMRDTTMLVERWHIAHPEATDRLGIVGANDDGETFTMHSFGSNGVPRVYDMSLKDGVWKLGYSLPELSQRFEGKFSDNGNTITAYWERSTDGSNWQRDFDLFYYRVMPAANIKTKI